MIEYKEIFNTRGHLYNEASSMCPGARESERIALIKLLNPKPGETIVDAPSGGGYLAEGLRKQCGNTINIICIEPAEHFAAAIDPAFRILLEPIDAITSLENQCLDAVSSLAGLHHFVDKRPTYREWKRLIRPGGRIAVADVATNTGTANFLNTFVDEFTPGGHQGLFFPEGEWTEQLSECGFIDINEELCSVPWIFENADQMVSFCRSLFGIQKAHPGAIKEALHHYIGVEPMNNGSVQIMWELRYVIAYTPHI